MRVCSKRTSVCVFVSGVHTCILVGHVCQYKLYVHTHGSRYIKRRQAGFLPVWVGTHTQKEIDPQKKTCLVMEKYVEDVLDLVESLIRPTCHIKEQLRRNLFNMLQFRPNI